MFGGLDVATSGMIAQRTRMATIASNIANRDTLLNADGAYDPYRRRAVLLEPGDPGGEGGLGVRVAEIHADQSALRLAYRPGHPLDQDGDGYIQVPDINPVMEQVNALEAARAYEANAASARAARSMVAQALRILA